MKRPAKFPPRPGAQPRLRQPRRSLSNLGGPTVTSGDEALASILRIALDVPPEPEAGRDHVHGFHSYPARMHPHTARVLVRELCPVGSLVVDPFCGSGTTLVEARLAGRRGAGVDANPLAVRLAAFKSGDHTPWQLADFLRAAQAIAALAQDRRKGRHGSSRRYLDDDYQAFDPHILLELDSLRVGIEALAPGTWPRTGLELVLSSLLTKLSRNAGDTAETDAPKRLAAGYPSRLFVKKTEELVGRMQDFHRMLRPPIASAPSVVEGDARQLARLVTGPVALVVTSPPYPGNYDYLQHHERRLRWLGLDVASLDRCEVGARRHLEPLPFPDALKRWKDDLGTCLTQIARVLGPTGKALFLLADSVLTGRAVDNERAVHLTAKDAGLRVVATASQPRPHLHAPTRHAFRDRPRQEHAILLSPL